MPSEKTRYLKERTKRMAPPPVKWQHLLTHLEAIESKELARLLWHAGEYHDVVGKVVQMHVGLNEALPDDLTAMKKAVDHGLNILDYISYDRSDAYSQILDEILLFLKRLCELNKSVLALELGKYAIEKTDTVSDLLQDAHFWHMSKEEIEEFLDKVRV